MKKIISLLFLIALGLKASSQTVSVTVPTAPCDSNGVVVAHFTGATPPIDVYWITNSGYVTHLGVTATTDTLLGFTGGRVQVYGFITSTSVSTNFLDTVIPLPFVIHETTAYATCPALGTLTASVTGGTGPFSYTWTNVSTGVVASTGNPASVGSGDYRLLVKDAAGCILGYDSTFYIYVTPDFTDTVRTTTAVCPALGTASVTISGGTGPFTYQWFNSGSIMVSTANPASLTSDYYTVVITDALGCTASNYAYITVFPDFTSTVTTTPANCTNGTASVALTGGTPPYSYYWSTGATTSSISGLIMGYYRVLVTDALGCSNDTLSGDSVTQAITIYCHNVTTSATCLDTNGSITEFGSGGVSPYSYLWSNGATTQTVGSQPAGYLSVIVTDANGCLGFDGNYINSSTPITVTYATTASSCTAPTGSATLSVSGGTPPYTINWYTTPPQTGFTATALPPGNYSFHITDALGCTQSGTVVVPPVDMLYLTFSSSPATCLLSNGSVAVTGVYGGLSPFTYHWSSGATTAAVSGLPASLYYVTVTDANGCSVTNCQYVPYFSPLTLGVSNTPASCLYTHDGVITATAALGTPPYTYSNGISTTTTGVFSGLPTDPYWVSVTDASGCVALDYTFVDYNVYDSSCFCLVKGVVYHDTNDNCIRDLGEVGIDNIQLHCSGLGYSYTDSSGNYYFLVPSGSYTISQRILGFYPLSACQVNNIPYTAVAGTGCTTTINFADTIDPIHDMHISTWDYNFAIPGYGYTQVSVISNQGTVTETNVLAGYKPDGQLFSPSFVPSGIFTGSPYWYNTAGGFPSMAPGASERFYMNYTVPANIPLGTNCDFKDSVAYQAPMSNWLTDYSPWNNVRDWTTTVVASHDPNFKEVYPKGTGSLGYITYNPDSILEYMVHFQNTGNYMAQNIVVRDTLSSNLDWTSLTPVYLSNKGTVSISETGVATFTFPDIDLPPVSSDPMSSNAMFTYTIKLKTGLATGTQIRNHASVYFDFNAPILTDTTLNTIGEQTQVFNITPVAGNGFTIYPNPANNTCIASVNSEINGNADLAITDIEGRTIMTKTIALQKGQQEVTLNVAQFTPGIYFVTIYGNGNPRTQKLVIMK